MADIFTAGFTLDDRLKATQSDNGTTYGVGMMVDGELVSLEQAMFKADSPKHLTAFASRRIPVRVPQDDGTIQVERRKAISTVHVTPLLAADEALVGFMRRQLDEGLEEFEREQGGNG